MNKAVSSNIRNNILNHQSELRSIFTILLLALFAALFAFPMLLSITDSFMSNDEIKQNYSADTINSRVNNGQSPHGDQYMRVKLIPDEVTIHQYYTILINDEQYLFLFWNSIKIVLPIVFGQILISSMASYAFSLFRSKWSDFLFFVYIIIMLMPFQVTLVPNYIVADKLGIIGSHWSIILPGVFSTFGVFLLRQYMINIPAEYLEAAKMDGASYLDIFINIIIPMTKTGIAALAILTFIDNWNMVEQPLIFIKDAVKEPLSLYLATLNQEEPGLAFAASVFYMLPMLLSFLYWEDYLVEGIQLSGIKA